MGTLSCIEVYQSIFRTHTRWYISVLRVKRKRNNPNVCMFRFARVRDAFTSAEAIKMTLEMDLFSMTQVWTSCWLFCHVYCCVSCCVYCWVCLSRLFIVMFSVVLSVVVFLVGFICHVYILSCLVLCLVLWC